MLLDIDVFGDKQLSRKLLRFANNALDMQPIFRELADDFRDMEEEQFDSEGRFSGSWAPLKESTIAKKAAEGLDPRILHATFALRESLTRQGAPGSVVKITREELVLGTDVRSEKGFPYAAAHQNPKKGQTRRRPIEFTPATRILWVKKVQRYIVGADRGEFF